MTITDTQILSYYFGGRVNLPSHKLCISSATASEFLLMYSDNPAKANYYPILPHRYHLPYGSPTGGSLQTPKIFFDSRRHALSGQRRTDKILMYFGNQSPSFVEFGSLAISHAINQGNVFSYSVSIAHLPKKRQKFLKKKFRFLVDSGIQCSPVTKQTVAIGMNLLALFLEHYEPKANLRNTINDMLVLATAMDQSLLLNTDDDLLRRFAADVLKAHCSPCAPVGTMVDFLSTVPNRRQQMLDSKGYINRGWQFMERR